jgi:bifunctional ADP-heptose synthase (sugar kinase/adenylyltransferase)
VAAVTGYFDVLRTDDVRELEQIRSDAAAKSLVAVILPKADEVLPQQARAELAAALRVIDYVVIADDSDPDTLLASLQPDTLVRLEAAHERRTRQLREHVRSRQTR